jgi:diadenylate cyclase
LFETLLSNIPASLLSFRLADILDIAIVAYIFYMLSAFVRETRAGTLIKGIVLLMIFTWLSNFLQLNTINYLLRNLMQFAFMAFIVIFQPELRRALEKVGRTNFSSLFSQEDNSSAETIASEIAAAAVAMSSRRIGALIVLERNTKIGDIVRTGCEIDSNVSSELLINIFIPNTPLHDGAVIIRENRIAAARCILPLTQNETLSREFGTRHRAALGLSECSDAAVIVVSEETGKISFTLNGNMSRNYTEDTLKKVIMKVLSADSAGSSDNTLAKWKERLKWKK